MALRYSIEQHHVCFPTKVLSERVGRTLNMVIKPAGHAPGTGPVHAGAGR